MNEALKLNSGRPIIDGRPTLDDVREQLRGQFICDKESALLDILFHLQEELIPASSNNNNESSLSVAANHQPNYLVVSSTNLHGSDA